MDARAIIARLRRGKTPSRDELQWFAHGLANGQVSDAQAGAFAMAVCLNGLGEEGRVGLTEAMRDSGDVLKWDMPGPVLDKHSTGGVGDCVSLILAPALAACGVFVPMISGRGLGPYRRHARQDGVHPRRVAPDQRGQAARRDAARSAAPSSAPPGDIAPADKRLYAIRDVTATVEVGRPDHRLDPVQEARRRAGGAGAGRQGRLGRLHEDRGRGPRIGDRRWSTPPTARAARPPR